MNPHAEHVASFAAISQRKATTVPQLMWGRGNRQPGQTPASLSACAARSSKNASEEEA